MKKLGPTALIGLLFTIIVIGEAVNFDTSFSWTVQPSVSGSNIYNSDNTYVPYDAANGQTFGPQPPEVPVVEPTPVSATVSPSRARTVAP